MSQWMGAVRKPSNPAVISTAAEAMLKELDGVIRRYGVEVLSEVSWIDPDVGRALGTIQRYRGVL